MTDCLNRSPEWRPTFHADMRVVLDKLKQIVKQAGGQVEDKPYNSYFTYIRFILNGYIYYFQIDNNPFFPHYYTKTRVVNGRYSLDVYMDDLQNTWMERLEKYSRNTDECLERVAEDLYKTLLAAKDSEKYRETETKAVPNTYDGGTHTEKVFRPERLAKVDF